MSEDTLYDVLIVCEDPGRRIAPRGGEAMIRHLAVTRVMRPETEAVADEWVEIYCKAGPSAHEAFVEGGRDDDRPIFQEGVVRFGTRERDIPFGLDDQKVSFFVLFQGCEFKDVTGRFKKKFKDILATRSSTLVREHTGLLPHLEVPEDELPRDKRRKRSGACGPSAGTRVEEW